MSVTRNDVARLAGVSTATVSYVVNNGPRPVSDATRQKVLKAIEKLNYQPSAIARSLKTKRTATIGVIVSDILNPVLSAMAKGIEDAILERDCNMILCNSDEDPGRELRFLKMLVSKMADGIILQPTGGNIDYLLSLVHDRKLPLVLVDRNLESLGLDSVLFDNEQGAYQAARHLIAMGHRRIAIISLPTHLTPGHERLAGYRRALGEAGIPIDPALVIEGGFKVENQTLVEALLAKGQPPTALIACSNRHAARVLQYAMEHSLRIPEDLALVVFDDIAHYAYITPTISAISTDVNAFGQAAGQLLIEHIKGARPAGRAPEKIRIPCKLIVRDSSRVPLAQIQANYSPR